MSLLKVKQISQWNEERYLIYTIYKTYIKLHEKENFYIALNGILNIYLMLKKYNFYFIIRIFLLCK